MFRSVFDHPQGDIFFTSVTKDKLIRFVAACLLYLLCFVLMLLRALPSLVAAVLHRCDWFSRKLVGPVQYSKTQAREGIHNQHKTQQV